MRALILLVLAAAAFGWLLLHPHLRAEEVLERERRALGALIAFSGGAAAEAEGYRFVRDAPEGRIVLHLAVPEGDVVRWFATPDGKELFQFDTVRKRPDGGGPDLELLRGFLSLSAEKQAEWGPPGGWEPCRTIPSP